MVNKFPHPHFEKIYETEYVVDGRDIDFLELLNKLELTHVDFHLEDPYDNYDEDDGDHYNPDRYDEDYLKDRLLEEEE